MGLLAFAAVLFSASLIVHAGGFWLTKLYKLKQADPARTLSLTDAQMTDRLERIEQAVEAVAIEVERLGEAQRFQARLEAPRLDVSDRPV